MDPIVHRKKKFTINAPLIRRSVGLQLRLVAWVGGKAANENRTRLTLTGETQKKI